MISATFKPATPDWKARLEDSFGRQAAMRTLGISILDLKPGAVDLGFPFDERLTQQHGFIHAGITTTALDSACGYAAFSLMPADAAVLTIELKTNLLAPASGARFVCEGRVIKAGRTIVVTEGKAWAFGDTHADARPRLIATMSATMMTVIGRDAVIG
ncbi:MAG TPA: PaaI family thioesterase [Hyphomicrobiaceae bacterium]|nr:PaaI family thioesterase [Hyphomicrobiaceae bacterium]